MVEQKKRPLEDDYVLSLIDQYGKLVRRVVNTRLKASYPDSVEDAIQDTYEAFCRQADDIRCADSPSAYICKIAMRNAEREYKRRVALDRPLPLDDVLMEDPHDPGLDEILPESTSPRDRAILNQIFHENMTAVEVAEFVGSNPATVRAEKKRALDRLRKRLKIFGK